MAPHWNPITIGGDAPPPAGAYSPAIRAGDFLYVSGQVPRDPKTGETIGTTVEEQTRQTIKNLEAVLSAGGAKLSDVIQCTVHLADPDLWGAFNNVYKELMPKPYPTRTAAAHRYVGFSWR